MNTYQIYDAVFDEANDYKQNTPDYIQDYALNALGVTITKELAQNISDCHTKYLVETGRNGEGQNNHWHYVRKPLSEIEVN